MLADSAADIVRVLLIDLGQGVRASTRGDGTPWPITTGKELPKPDEVITVKDTQGTDDGRIMIDGSLVYHYGLQIRIRSMDERTGYTKAETVRTALAAVRRRVATVNGSGYKVHAITHIGPVLPIGDEAPQSRRKVFTLNCTAAITS